MGNAARKVRDDDLRYIVSGRPISPRVNNAIRLYASGAVKSKSEAARLAGLDARTLSVLNRNPLVIAAIAKINAEIDAGTINMAEAIRRLGQQGVAKIANLMVTSQREDIQFKAAQDLADRSPETAKTQKVSLEADITLPASTVADLAKALLEQASRKEKYIAAAQGDYIKVNETAPLALPAPQENK